MEPWIRCPKYHEPVRPSWCVENRISRTECQNCKGPEKPKPKPKPVHGPGGMHNSHGQLDEAIRLLSEGQLLNYQIAEITGLNPNTVGKLKKALAQ